METFYCKMDFKFNFLDELLNTFDSEQKCIDFLEKLICSVVANTQSESLIPVIRKYIKQDAIVMTDDWRPYRILQNHYQHSFVYHQKKQYVIGNIHTNTI